MSLCEFELRAHFVGDGLLGGTHEYAPYLGVHATFGAHKCVRRLDLVAAGGKMKGLGAAVSDAVFAYEGAGVRYTTREAPRFVLEHYGDEETRVDEMLWAEVWCHTRDTGIAEMDARESRWVERHISCGQVQLPVHEILSAFRAGGERLGEALVFSQDVVDERVVAVKLQQYRAAEPEREMTEALFRQYAMRAANDTSKGVLELEVRVRHFDAALYARTPYARPNFHQESLSASLLDLGRQHSGREPKVSPPLSFTSSAGVARMMQTLQTHVLQPYCTHFLRLSESDPEPLYAPSNSNVANLQLPMWRANIFMLPVQEYWASLDVPTRVYHSPQARARDEALYGYRARAERHMLMMLEASLLRHGMDGATFERVVREHYASTNRATDVDALFLVCDEVVADVGTFAANSAHYTADFRYVAQKRARDRTGEAVRIDLDSWDHTVMNNIGNDDDCEGTECVASPIIRVFGTGRVDLGGKWESPLLESVRLLLQQSVVHDLGATVTSAYFDAKNEKLERCEELPMAGDEMDLRATCAGHCHGAIESLSAYAAKLERGNVGEDALRRVRAALPQDEAVARRETMRVPLILEPTGSIDPRILPLAESYARHPLMGEKKRAQWLFQRTLKKAIAAEEGMGELLVPEGLVHYAEAQDPRRRISSFYNQPVFGVSVDAARRFGATLGQYALCQRASGDRNWCYGVDVADFLRGSGEQAYVAPFYGERLHWEEHVAPYVESVQHQLPLSSFGRWSDEEFGKTHASFVPARRFAADYAFDVPLVAEGDEAAEQQRFEKLARATAHNPHYTIARLYSHPWRLRQSAEKTAALHRQLAGASGVVALACYVQHHLPVCDPVVEFLAVIDVRTCLALGK